MLKLAIIEDEIETLITFIEDVDMLTLDGRRDVVEALMVFIEEVGLLEFLEIEVDAELLLRLMVNADRLKLAGMNGIEKALVISV